MAGSGGGRLCFFDNVMWFIRVLLCLYLMFGVYSIAKSRASNVTSVGVLLCMTVVCFLCVAYWGAFFHAMSIPIFTIGVLISDFDKQLIRYILNHYIFASLLILIVALAIPFRSADIVPHVIINYLIILAIIKLFAHVTISVTGLPKWLSPQSFNVYLVHNKVLMFGNALMPVVNFVVYIGVVIAVTVLFSIVRKVLQI